MSESNENSSDGRSCVLLVHGKDFKPGEEEYFDCALAATTAAIQRDYPDSVDAYKQSDKRLCYYGDLSNELLTSYGLHYDEVLDVGDRRNALTQMKMLDKRKQFGIDRYDRLPGKSAVTEFVADVFSPLMALLGFSKPLVARNSKDVAEYWYGKSDYAETVRARVRDKLCAALDENRKILLISHGTGSVVAYDVLWELSHDPRYADKYKGQKVDTWLTLGSPLGDTLVRRQLMGSKKKGREKYPDIILTWHNVSAEDDYLCHDNTVADDFKPMMKLRMISSIRDYKMYNLCVRYGKSNPHSSLGYYIHPRTAQLIVEWLKSGEVEPSLQSNPE